MVLFLDMNSYFAAVEQQVRPELRGSPIGIIPNDCDSTCCIAASYEAKAHGIKTGTGVRDAKARCPSIRIVISRPDVYIEHHHKIVEAVETVHPVHQVHSIDEMSIKLRGRDRDPLAARQLAMEMKAAIRSRVGEWMRCSIGIAPNSMLAKTAGEMVKPDGMVVIEPDELPHRLYTLKVTDLPGINTGIENRLRRHGIYTMPQLCTASKRRLREAWGSIVGETWWEWLHGNDPWIKPTKTKNIGHQHVLAPELRPCESARAVAIRLLMKAATRMRAEGWWSTKLTLSVRPMDDAPWSVYQNLEPCQCTVRLLHHLDQLWAQRTTAFVFCLGVTLGGLVRDGCVEEPLFAQDRKQTALAHTMDRINGRYGHAKVYYASMHDAKQAAPRRIPFSGVPRLDLPDVV
jgi:DNA polymerase-4